MEFERHVYAVQRYVEFTQPKYAQLFKPGVQVHPICGFGEVEKATVVTVSANPSVGEFEGSHWPATIDHIELAKRCKGYFRNDSPGPCHRFFSPWKDALKRIDIDYQSGGAVHVDLSPRPTRLIREFEPGFQNELFLEMVHRDLWVFFATLQLCEAAKILLIAGSVTGRYYINEFLQRFSPDFGDALGGAFDRRQHPGKAKTCWHELDYAEKTWPVFFCSSGAAANEPDLLARRICENKEDVKQRLQR